MPGRREREPALECVDAVSQIVSNYQAALHLFEEAVAGEAGGTVPRQLLLELLEQAARAVFEPVLESCAGAAPGLDDLVTECIVGAGRDVPEVPGLRDLVVAERQRVAATHSRLIRRRPRLLQAAADRAELAAAARRLDDLETGSHAAGALFNLLLERWREMR